MARSGTRALGLLTTPLNGRILLELCNGSRSAVELRRACDSPAQTTLRAHLKELDEAGVILRGRSGGFPGAVECSLTQAGDEFLFVAQTIEGWLRAAPDEPLSLGSAAARAPIKALVDACSSPLLRAIAGGPISLTELDGIVESLSYPALQRRLAAMRLAGQLRSSPSHGNATNPYMAADWLRTAMAPLTAAMRWERRHLATVTPPIGAIDIEAALLLTTPLVRLPAGLSGSCRLAAETEGGRRRVCGILIKAGGKGGIESYTTKLDGRADAWAQGSASTWLAAIIDGELAGLDLGGKHDLARGFVEALHGALFAPRARHRSGAFSNLPLT